MEIAYYVVSYLKMILTRYNELKRKVKGITNMMLTKSLKELEEHNLIVRISI